jgi:hypothetical protein
MSKSQRIFTAIQTVIIIALIMFIFKDRIRETMPNLNIVDTKITTLSVGTLWTNSVGINGAASAKQFASGFQNGGAATGNTSFGITFGYTPNVVASVYANDITAVFGVQITAVSTTGFSYRKTFYRFNGAYGGDAVSEAFFWIAM